MAVQLTMSKVARPIVAAAGLLLSGALLSAEEAPPAPPPPKAEPAKPVIEVSGPTTRMSAERKSSIAAGVRYAPPPKEEPKKTVVVEDRGDEEALPESTPIAPDQPRNKIIRLPKYIVEGDRPPVFRERDIYTKQALAAIAMRRYLSSFDRNFLNRFHIPFLTPSSEARAMAMYEEDERLQNISDLKQSAADARKAGDNAGADYLSRETNRTFLRSGGMDWNNWSR
jgi:hypothetical protein